jgi:hypothetical protein
MIFASFLGIFVIPPLYVIFQKIAERLKRDPLGRAVSQPALEQDERRGRYSAGPAE